MSAMFKLSYGLFVVTARDGEKDNGCITNTVQQVTAAPNRISLAVNKANFTHDMILKSGVFNVSIISEKADFELFKRFGFASGRDTDKFAGYGAAERAENGVLYVTEGTNSVLSAQVVQTVDLGTHTLFIADVAGEKFWTKQRPQRTHTILSILSRSRKQNRKQKAGYAKYAATSTRARNFLPISSALFVSTLPLILNR